MPKVVNVDLEQIEKLGMFQVTLDELAAWFKVEKRTVYRWMKRADVVEAFERGKANGRISLRQAQFKSALGGNPTMLIWMGKQLLNQKDQVHTEHSGDLTLNDGARERLISKLNSLSTATAYSEGDQRPN